MSDVMQPLKRIYIAGDTRSRGRGGQHKRRELRARQIRRLTDAWWIIMLMTS